MINNDNGNKSNRSNLILLVLVLIMTLLVLTIATMLLPTVTLGTILVLMVPLHCLKIRKVDNATGNLHGYFKLLTISKVGNHRRLRMHFNESTY